MNSGYLAYLVGPDVFHPQAGTVFSHLRDACQRHGIEGLEPVDGGLSKGADCSPTTARKIYEGNVGLMLRAHGIIANLQAFRGAEMDSGSAFEIGYGLALGKPVVGYFVNDGLSYAQRVNACGGGTHRNASNRLVDAFERPVEDFDLPVPVMVWHALSGFAPSPDEAAKWFPTVCGPLESIEATPPTDRSTAGGTLELTCEMVSAFGRAESLGMARPWFDLLLKKIRYASDVIAEVNSFRGFEPSGSMAMLIGYAVGMGKPVDLVLSDHRDHGQRVTEQVGTDDHQGRLYCRAHGWLVENMGLPVNLMLACSARAILTPTMNVAHASNTPGITSPRARRR